VSRYARGVINYRRDFQPLKGPNPQRCPQVRPDLVSGRLVRFRKLAEGFDRGSRT
jgi:hypothetical protein